jgi:hypothetical protein
MSNAECNTLYSQSMQRTLSSGDPAETQQDEPGGVEQLKTRYQVAERPCRHALTSRTQAPKIHPMAGIQRPNAVEPHGPGIRISF